MTGKKKIVSVLQMIILTVILILSKTETTISAEETISEGELYAISACLMDGDTGRVLYEKNGEEIRANASTTKILTCILALEYGNLDDIVTVSKYAASMPDVQLNINTGEQYILRDLLYSLMLESHNDSAVAIAEHISGSVEAFSDLMNEKAKELGCYNSFFITPNGLDSTKTVGAVERFHGTTAVDLAKIMAYCIKNQQFLDITQTQSYTFSNKKINSDGELVNGGRTFTVNNKNAFLTMMDGVISGKTGFTNNAGYCYVGALERDGKTLIVALLGCGWPNNKNYKWSDTKKLMNYGLDNFIKQDLFDYDYELKKVLVTDGKTNENSRDNIVESIELDTYICELPLEMLICNQDNVQIKYIMEKELTAPVYDGQVVGGLYYYINDQLVKTYPVYVEGNVEKADLLWFIKSVVKKYLFLT